MKRHTFSISRTSEFFSEKELTMQMGASPDRWLPVLIKELTDNALDACEGPGRAPKITVSISAEGFSVADNGPGIPEETVRRTLDYTTSTSSNALYVASTRGQLGNALKCLYAAGYVRHGASRIEIDAQGVRHKITVDVDEIAQQPVISHEREASNCKNGTIIKVAWPNAATELQNAEFTIEVLLSRFCLANPHVDFCIEGPDGECRKPAADIAFKKWFASRPSSAHWYSLERFRNLVCGVINQHPDSFVRKFLCSFDGMRATAKGSDALDALGISRGQTMRQVFAPNGKPDMHRIKSAHDYLLHFATDPVKARSFGRIGKDHVARLLGTSSFGEILEKTIRYKPIECDDECQPFVVEAWFAAKRDTENERTLLVSLNHSPVLQCPFEELHDMLAQNQADQSEPVILALHVECPSFDYTDRGKSRIELDQRMCEAIREAVDSVCKDWCKMRKRQRRTERADEKAMEKLERRGSREISAKDAAYDVMEQAYMQASGNGQLPANARQIMYAARPLVQKLTGKPLDDEYFTQHLLPDYLIENPEQTAQWVVAYDARGTLQEPHTRRSIPVGTMPVRQYLQSCRTPRAANLLDIFSVRDLIDTWGPAGRFSAALFIEKEGFGEIFGRAQTAELFDLAIFSTKGMTTTSGRQLTEFFSEQGVRTLLLHDFDNAGMTIAQTFRADSRRYQYKGEINVADLGLRLTDVEMMNLQSEGFFFPKKQNKDPRENLRSCGATEEECAFLVEGKKGGCWHGKRVELNAMTAPQFVEFVHRKLTAAGVHKVIPDDDATLQMAWNAENRRLIVKSAVERELAQTEGRVFTMPVDLRERLEAYIEGKAMPWDKALAALAAAS